MIHRAIVRLTLVIAVSAFSFHVSAQPADDAALKEINEHRKKQQSEFRDPDKSPLDKKERKKFKGLNYYPIDLNFRVKAVYPIM